MFPVIVKQEISDSISVKEEKNTFPAPVNDKVTVKVEDESSSDSYNILSTVKEEDSSVRASQKIELESQECSPNCTCDRCCTKFQPRASSRTTHACSHANKNSLDRRKSTHLSENIKIEKEDDHQSEKADTGFTLKKSLQTRKQTHSVKRRYFCDICGKGFLQSKSVKLHKLIHTGEKPHVCVFCNRGFTQKQALRCHYRTHRAKPYYCDVCQKGFDSLARQKSHKCGTTSHTFECLQCNRKFVRKYHLERHEEIHFSKDFITFG